MWHHRYHHWIFASWLALLAVLPGGSMAAGSSALSRWLSHEVVPELEELLSSHPRFAGQRLQLQGGQSDALSESIAIVLAGNIGQMEGVRLVAPGSLSASPVWSTTIDEVDCRPGPKADYLLRIDASSRGARRGQVRLNLLAADEPRQLLRSWQWVGSFTSAESEYFARAASADGSLTAPWTEADVDAAAQSLARDLACALRPGLATRVSLHWSARRDLPSLFADAFNASRHQLGSLPEVTVATGPADYDIAARVEPFRDDVWQLWLTGSPRQAGWAPVQAVTYIRATNLEIPGASIRMADAAVPPQEEQAAIVEAAALPPADPAVMGDALEFVDVELIDAYQSDRSGSRADLQVTLRVANRGDWPIHYSFTLSGGHFRHCIASPSNYRHDRYGSVSGSVEPGSSVVQRLLIENARHQPTPLFGTRKCAGFRDLDGFEQFASKGYKVTDYVRWEL